MLVSCICDVCRSPGRPPRNCSEVLPPTSVPPPPAVAHGTHPNRSATPGPSAFWFRGSSKPTQNQTCTSHRAAQVFQVRFLNIAPTGPGRTWPTNGCLSIPLLRLEQTRGSWLHHFQIKAPKLCLWILGRCALQVHCCRAGPCFAEVKALSRNGLSEYVWRLKAQVAIGTRSRPAQHWGGRFPTKNIVTHAD